MELPTPKNEPVAYAGLVIILANWIVPWAMEHGISVDAATVSTVLTAIIGALVAFARSRVHPDIKVQEKVAAARAEGVALGAARGPS
jgi:hypothetical protein